MNFRATIAALILLVPSASMAALPPALNPNNVRPGYNVSPMPTTGAVIPAGTGQGSAALLTYAVNMVQGCATGLVQLVDGLALPTTVVNTCNIPVSVLPPPGENINVSGSGLAGVNTAVSLPAGLSAEFYGAQGGGWFAVLGSSSAAGVVQAQNTANTALADAQALQTSSEMLAHKGQPSGYAGLDSLGTSQVRINMQTASVFANTGPNDSDIWINRSISGTASGSNGTNFQAVNSLVYTDTIDAPAGGIHVEHCQDTLGASWSGFRVCNYGLIIVGQPPDPAALTAPGGRAPQVAGMYGGVTLKASLGGSGNPAVAANYLGGVFGANPQVRVQAGSTMIGFASGAEVDEEIAAGATVADAFGLNIVHTTGHAARGIFNDAAIIIGTQGGPNDPGWLTGLQIGNVEHSWPLAADSSILRIVQTTSGTQPLLNGIDLRLGQFQSGGYAFASPGYSVDPSGNLVAHAYAGDGSNIQVTPSGGGSALSLAALAASIVGGNSYVLPNANASTLGGVRVDSAFVAGEIGGVPLLGGLAGLDTLTGVNGNGISVTINGSAATLQAALAAAGQVQSVVGQTGSVTAAQIYTADVGTTAGTFPDAGAVAAQFANLGTLYATPSQVSSAIGAALTGYETSSAIAAQLAAYTAGSGNDFSAGIVNWTGGRTTIAQGINAAFANGGVQSVAGHGGAVTAGQIYSAEVGTTTGQLADAGIVAANLAAATTQAALAADLGTYYETPSQLALFASTSGNNLTAGIAQPLYAVGPIGLASAISADGVLDLKRDFHASADQQSGFAVVSTTAGNTTLSVPTAGTASGVPAFVAGVDDVPDYYGNPKRITIDYVGGRPNYGPIATSPTTLFAAIPVTNGGIYDQSGFDEPVRTDAGIGTTTLAAAVGATSLKFTLTGTALTVGGNISVANQAIPAGAIVQTLSTSGGVVTVTWDAGHPATAAIPSGTNVYPQSGAQLFGVYKVTGAILKRQAAGCNFTSGQFYENGGESPAWFQLTMSFGNETDPLNSSLTMIPPPSANINLTNTLDAPAGSTSVTFTAVTADQNIAVGFGIVAANGAIPAGAVITAISNVGSTATVTWDSGHASTADIPVGTHEQTTNANYLGAFFKVAPQGGNSHLFTLENSPTQYCQTPAQVLLTLQLDHLDFDNARGNGYPAASTVTSDGLYASTATWAMTGASPPQRATLGTPQVLIQSQPYVGNITHVNSSTSVTVSPAIPETSSGTLKVNYYWGHNDQPAAVLAAAAANTPSSVGGTVRPIRVTPGVYYLDGPIPPFTYGGGIQAAGYLKSILWFEPNAFTGQAIDCWDDTHYYFGSGIPSPWGNNGVNWGASKNGCTMDGFTVSGDPQSTTREDALGYTGENENADIGTVAVIDMPGSMLRTGLLGMGDTIGSLGESNWGHLWGWRDGYDGADVLDVNSAGSRAANEIYAGAIEIYGCSSRCVHIHDTGQQNAGTFHINELRAENNVPTTGLAYNPADLVLLDGSQDTARWSNIHIETLRLTVINQDYAGLKSDCSQTASFNQLPEYIVVNHLEQLGTQAFGPVVDWECGINSKVVVDGSDLSNAFDVKIGPAGTGANARVSLFKEYDDNKPYIRSYDSGSLSQVLDASGAGAGDPNDPSTYVWTHPGTEIVDNLAIRALASGFLSVTGGVVGSTPTIPITSVSGGGSMALQNSNAVNETGGSTSNLSESNVAINSSTMLRVPTYATSPGASLLFGQIGFNTATQDFEFGNSTATPWNMVHTSQLGANGGVATLDGTGHLTPGQLPTTVPAGEAGVTPSCGAASNTLATLGAIASCGTGSSSGVGNAALSSGYVSGRFYIPQGLSLSGVAIGNALRPYAEPIYITSAASLKSLSINITSANSSAIHFRCLLFADNGSGAPGSVVPNADTGSVAVAASATGGQTGTLATPASLTAGWYWIVTLVDVTGESLSSVATTSPLNSQYLLGASTATAALSNAGPTTGLYGTALGSISASFTSFGSASYPTAGATPLAALGF